MLPGANNSKLTKMRYDVGVKYINKWMKENQHPPFDALTSQDVEANHLQMYMEDIFHWLSATPLTFSSYKQNQQQQFTIHMLMVWMSQLLSLLVPGIHTINAISNHSRNNHHNHKNTHKKEVESMNCSMSNITIRPLGTQQNQCRGWHHTIETMNA